MAIKVRKPNSSFFFFRVCLLCSAAPRPLTAALPRRHAMAEMKKQLSFADMNGLLSLRHVRAHRRMINIVL